MAWVWRRILARFDPAIATQDLMNGGRHRHRLSLPLQAVGDLARAPRRMLVTNSQNRRLDRSITALGHGMRPAGTIGQLSIASLPARQPLVADIRADPEPSEELPPVRSFLQSKPYQLAPLIHH